MPTETRSAARPDPLAKAGETAANSFDHVATHASASARAAAHRVKATAHSGAYKSAYGVAYGIVFSGVFLAELLPAGNVFRRGLEDGASDGLDAAVARSAARHAKKRLLIEAEEDLDLDDEAATEVKAEAPPAAARAPNRKKRAAA